MSDEPKALPARRPGAPAAGGPRPARPAAKPPADTPGSLRLRKMLLLGIVLACLGLSGGIVWKLFGPKGTGQGPIDVDKVFEEQMEAAKEASGEIFKIQTKVWGKNQDLTAEDFATVKTKLESLRACHEKVKDLLDILRQKNMTDTGSFQAIVPKWLQLKMWILDAADLLDNQKPPEYGGLTIPMFVTSEKIRKATAELSEINTLKDEIIKESNPEKIKATRKKIADLREAFRGYGTKMQDLDKYVAEGLARPDLTTKDVRELEQLRDEANKANMAVRAAGDLLKAFPE